ncbi:MAG: phosphoglucosamine mutase [Dehalococcoidales bacterium]|nr:phosphoglucosamine mutase [Dehalococcoidales bacterium]
MHLFGSSGIRTIFNKDLLDIAFKVGLAVGSTYRNVVVGRDTRTSGVAMKHAVISGLLASGAVCRDAGIISTPTLAYVTREFAAGIEITASHNPPEYNGIKLFNPDGSSFTLDQQEKLENQILSGGGVTADWQKLLVDEPYAGAIEKHIEAIAAHFPDYLRTKVVVDAGCGAGSEISPLLLKKLGCNVIQLNCAPSGFFPRGIEPVASNLVELIKTVKDEEAAVGIAHDGDADRMMAVDDKGRFITGDVMLAILAQAVMAKDMVTTLDASMYIDEMGLNVRRTKIGDSFVSEELRKGGDFGGETSGAWIFPDISFCPDGIYAAAVIATLAADQKLSGLVDAVPVYPLIRGNVDSQRIDMSELKNKLQTLEPLSVNDEDGIKMNFIDGWLLVRPSGTEPKIRITAEAKTKPRAQELYDNCLNLLNEIKEAGVKSN